jgi:hypothetical protein
MDAIEIPEYLHAEQGGYYLRRAATLEESLAAVALAEEIDHYEVKEVSLRPVAPPPPEERLDPEPLHARDSNGRFKRVWWWAECAPDDPAAEPFYYARWVGKNV